MLAFLAYPLGVLGSHVIDPAGWSRLFAATTWHVVPLALVQAFTSTVLAVVVGLPIANVVSRYQFRGRALAQAAVTVPFVLPTVVVALAFRTLLGPGVPQGFVLVVLAHAYVNLAVVVRIVGSQWAQHDPDVEHVARTLGASRWTAFRTVTLPSLRPAIASSAAVVFVFSFTSLGIVLLLGDSTTRTLESQILRQTSVLLDFPGATATAVVQLVLVTAVLVAGMVASRRSSRRRMRPVSLLPLPSSASGRLGVLGTAIFTFVIVSAPVAALVVTSLRAGGTWSLAWWTGVTSVDAGTSRIGSPLSALGTSIAYALVCALVACLVGGLAAVAVLTRGRTRLISLLAIVPLGHLLGDSGTRDTARLRTAPSRPARLRAARADRALARRGAVGRGGGRARAPERGLADHGRCRLVGRSPDSGLPHRLRIGAAHRHAGVGRAGVRRLVGRVRRRLVPHPRRQPHRAGADRPTAGPAR